MSFRERAANREVLHGLLQQEDQILRELIEAIWHGAVNASICPIHELGMRLEQISRAICRLEEEQGADDREFNDMLTQMDVDQTER